MNPFPGIHCGQLTDYRKEIATAFGLHAEDGESRFLIEESDALDQSGQLVGWLTGGRHTLNLDGDSAIL